MTMEKALVKVHDITQTYSCSPLRIHFK